MSSLRFPTATGAFQVPSIADAAELFKELRPRWGGWMESGLDGTFVVVPVPERISELNQLLAEVENWITRQSFLAIRFYLDGRVYILQRGGFIGPASPADKHSD
jgi:hypothetical protein